jgi:alanyl-tRNA synthetase
VEEAERWQMQLLELEKEIENQRKAAEQRRAVARSEELLERVRSRKDLSYIIEDLGDASADYLRAIAESLKSKNFPGVAVLAGTSAGRAGLVAYVGPSAVKRVQAGSIIKTLAPIIGGGGGGKPDFAQAGGKNPERIADALMEAERLVS